MKRVIMIQLFILFSLVMSGSPQYSQFLGMPVSESICKQMGTMGTSDDYQLMATFSKKGWFKRLRNRVKDLKHRLETYFRMKLSFSNILFMIIITINAGISCFFARVTYNEWGVRHSFLFSTYEVTPLNLFMLTISLVSLLFFSVLWWALEGDLMNRIDGRRKLYRKRKLQREKELQKEKQLQKKKNKLYRFLDKKLL